MFIDLECLKCTTAYHYRHEDMDMEVLYSYLPIWLKFNQRPKHHCFPTCPQVEVPEDLEAGEYVLSFRWDCKCTPQVGIKGIQSTKHGNTEMMQVPSPPLPSSKVGCFWHYIAIKCYVQ